MPGLTNGLALAIAATRNSRSPTRSRSSSSPGSVGTPARWDEDVADRRLALAVVGVLGDVVGDPVVDVERALLLEQVHDHRRERFRGRVDAERRLGRGQDLRRVGRGRRARCRGRGRWRGRARPGRGGAGRAQRRMHPAAIEIARAGPDVLDGFARQTEWLGVGLVGNRGDRLEVRRHANAAQRVREEGQPGDCGHRSGVRGGGGHRRTLREAARDGGSRAWAGGSRA